MCGVTVHFQALCEAGSVLLCLECSVWGWGPGGLREVSVGFVVYGGVGRMGNLPAPPDGPNRSDTQVSTREHRTHHPW